MKRNLLHSHLLWWYKPTKCSVIAQVYRSLFTTHMSLRRALVSSKLMFLILHIKDGGSTKLQVVLFITLTYTSLLSVLIQGNHYSFLWQFLQIFFCHLHDFQTPLMHIEAKREEASWRALNRETEMYPTPSLLSSGVTYKPCASYT